MSFTYIFDKIDIYHHKGIDFIADAQKQLNCFQIPLREICLCENRKNPYQGTLRNSCHFKF